MNDLGSIVVYMTKDEFEVLYISLKEASCPSIRKMRKSTKEFEDTAEILNQRFDKIACNLIENHE